MEALALLDRRVIGRSEYSTSRWNSNYVFFCPQCGDIWGRLYSSHNARWYPMIVSCENCGPSRFMDYAGSMLVCNEPDMLERFDEEFWQREAELHLKYHEWAIKYVDNFS